ncbi:MAG: deoxyguanosinetriphosphate triphosphohydrolase [Gammaproteobacteria bacterium]|nr:deoxyguanosinetriphosphate triphosphohydrolase [Gammaproteobacteria bacterium]
MTPRCGGRSTELETAARRVRLAAIGPPSPNRRRRPRLTELAPYAAHSEQSRGRRFAEPPPAYRNEFQRDRDRIVHSTAFRRLVYKTQVFVNHEGDHYRTRLTHSLEVAQIARTVARTMRLNEDLVEAVSLAHDLGHTPFGHAGQDALNDCMREHGGFEHNLQSLRVVDELEERYVGFPGLNLTFEAREGILKHCSLRNARMLGDIGRRFIERRQPGLEAQIANIADEIAYNNHDVDDGLRSGLISVEQLTSIPFFDEHYAALKAAHPGAAPERVQREVVRRMIDTLVQDLFRTSEAAVLEAAPLSIDDVRSMERPLIGFSAPFAETQAALKRFLMDHLYTHPHVRQMTQQAHETICLLFDAFSADYRKMPAKHAERAEAAEKRDGRSGAARVIADYIAGMTDRFALQTRDALR